MIEGNKGTTSFFTSRIFKSVFISFHKVAVETPEGLIESCLVLCFRKLSECSMFFSGPFLNFTDAYPRVVKRKLRSGDAYFMPLLGATLVLLPLIKAAVARS
jgi:hypothetical protein